MALHMICSHWLVCGWMLSLIVGTGVAIFQRQTESRTETSQLNSIEWSFDAFPSAKWDSGWARYADIQGRIDDHRMQIGRGGGQGIAGSWGGYDGSGWSYA